jgi:hypothetical protein
MADAYGGITMDEALRAAIEVLRDSAESRRMPSGEALDAAAASVHVDSAALLESLLPTAPYASATPILPGLQALREVMGEELLGQLGLAAVSISQATAEEQVADRLAWVGQVAWHLQGTYNNSGIRRWFNRPRVQLDGQSPIQALGQDWKADGASAARTGTTGTRRDRPDAALDRAKSALANGGWCEPFRGIKAWPEHPLNLLMNAIK